MRDGIEVSSCVYSKHCLYIDKTYNKAIDECKQILLDAMAKDGKTKCNNYMVALNEMENLKTKSLTCFDCYHHFMSDCYLECMLHDRINNTKVCSDFEFKRR